MIKQKSKSKIFPYQKREIKSSLFALKPKEQNQRNLKEKTKTSPQVNRTKQQLNQSKSNTNIQLKSKIPLQKSQHYPPKNSEHLDHQLIYSVERRNSASIVSQRAPSRISNKRSSVASCKSNKFSKDEAQKQNDQNQNNFKDDENHEKECQVDNLKKSFKDIKSKKKLSLNINKKPKCQIQSEKQANKKVQKNSKVHMFEKKMSKYLNQKDIFSEQFLSEKNPSKNKSKKNLNAKSKEKIEDKLEKDKRNCERDNLLQIYQFYKKTFDINLKNCVKKGSTLSKDDKSKHITSKTTIKPSNSSTVIFKKETTGKSMNYMIELCEKKNQSKCSNGSKSRSKSKDTLSQSRKNESKSNCDKENRLLSHIQMSSLLQSRSKSRNSMINSQNSTKDQLFPYQVDKSYANTTREEANLKRSKKSYKQLIVFNENQIKKQQETQDKKNLVETKKDGQTSKISNLKDSSRFIAKDQCSEIIDMKKIEIGESNVDVLNWWSNKKRQLSTSILKNERQNEKKQIKQDLLVNEKAQLREHAPEVSIEKLSQQNDLYQQFAQKNEPNVIIQEQSPKIIKKKSDEISSLEDLSSISSIHDQRYANSTRKFTDKMMFEAEDAAFEL